MSAGARPEPGPNRSRRARHPRPPRPRGIALVLVLWVLALLTVMALGLTLVQRSESTLTRNQVDGARFRTLADAAIALTVINLVATPLEMQEAPEAGALWVPDGSPRTLDFDGEELTVRIGNEASRLDLNAATPEQLQALLAVALEPGADDDAPPLAEATVEQLADAIVDWRDEDDLVSLNGAEDGDYKAAGLPYGARDGPFESVLDLRLVLGMTRALYARLEPDLTVENPGGSVDLDFASPAVLAAVQGLTLENAELEVAARTAPTDPGVVQARVVNRGGPLYRLRISQATDATARRTLEALVRIESGGLAPYEVIWRREGLFDPPDAALDAAAAPTP